MVPGRWSDPRSTKTKPSCIIYLQFEMLLIFISQVVERHECKGFLGGWGGVVCFSCLALFFNPRIDFFLPRESSLNCNSLDIIKNSDQR